MDFLKGYKTIIFNVASLVVLVATSSYTLDLVGTEGTAAIAAITAIGNFVLRFITDTSVFKS